MRIENAQSSTADCRVIFCTQLAGAIQALEQVDLVRRAVDEVGIRRVDQHHFDLRSRRQIEFLELFSQHLGDVDSGTTSHVANDATLGRGSRNGSIHDFKVFLKGKGIAGIERRDY